MFGLAQKPKLIVQITVDQLRGDLPLRYYAAFPEGGFKYFMDQGIWYEDAHHPHAATETVVGHTTLATGAYPSQHGMVANNWFDQELGRMVYNVEDPEAILLGSSKTAEEQKATEKVEGRSPRNILTSSFSDELKIATQGRAKSFAVSVKDRGSIPLAGRLGKAFWYDKSNGKFVSSDFYYDELPDWAKQWNKASKSDKYSGKSWELAFDKDSYIFKDDDNQAYENPHNKGNYGNTFPHSYGKKSDKAFYSLLCGSPAGDRLTADFAKTLIEQEKLGEDDVLDYLSVSFSCTDYVGHMFGPSSLESEDQIRQLDRILADFISYINDRVGEDNVLYVLSADHGVPEAGGHLEKIGMGKKLWLMDELELDAYSDSVMKKRFGASDELIRFYFYPYIYLNHAEIEARDLDVNDVSEVLARLMMKKDEIAWAIPSEELLEGEMPKVELLKQVSRNYHPNRSGDIFLVCESYVSLTSKTYYATVTHGSPWTYDTFVPLSFAGYGLAPQKVSQKVFVTDIAATLSVVAGSGYPSGCSGKPLKNVLGH
jgi:predicted AlkP superfamily pyrophosphatase or phosphodiesterase